jgi:CBS domain-containing protein
MQVRDIMTEHVAFCTQDAGVEDAAAMMVKSDCGAIPVIDPRTQKAVGIITDRDIVCRVVAKGQNPIGMRIEEVMTMPINAVSPATPLEDCLAKMEESQVRRMLVVDEQGKLRGIVSQADIARTAPEHGTAQLMKDVSKPTDHASRIR